VVNQHFLTFGTADTHVFVLLAAAVPYPQIPVEQPAKAAAGLFKPYDNFFHLQRIEHYFYVKAVGKAVYKPLYFFVKKNSEFSNHVIIIRKICTIVHAFCKPCHGKAEQTGGIIALWIP
jgi:hypothetical protein